MESSSLRLAISWAHPQGNTDSLWGKLKVCETMKKKRHKYTNKHNQTDTKYPTHKQRQAHKTHVSTSPRRHTLSLTQVGSVSCTKTNQRHNFKILFYFYRIQIKKMKYIDSLLGVPARSNSLGWRTLSRLEELWPPPFSVAHLQWGQ